MFTSRTSNLKINKRHERALRILYNDHLSTFNELLTRDKSVTMHVRNLRLLALEMFKIKNKLSPIFIVDFFEENEILYNFRNQREFNRPKIKTVQWGVNSIRYYGPIIWDMLPTYIKNSESLELFKQEIKKWDAKDCPCRLCKPYFNNLGFL